MKKEPYLEYKRLYAEINTKAFREFGEIEVIGNPMTITTLIETAASAPRGNFDLVYTGMLADFIELAGKRGKIIANILRHKDLNNCVYKVGKTLCGTKKGIASRTTLYSFLKEASDKGYIVLKHDGLMLNPQIMRRGNKAREAYLTNEFEQLRIKSETENAEAGETEKGKMESVESEILDTENDLL